MGAHELTTLRRTVGARVRRLTPEQARDIIARYSAKGGLQHEDIRNLTGGYNSQSINSYVIRKLAEHAGLAVKR